MSANTMSDTDGIVRIPGLPTLTHNQPGHPASVRWVAITPSGTVEVHTSDNQVAFDADDGMHASITHDRVTTLREIARHTL